MKKLAVKFDKIDIEKQFIVIKSIDLSDTKGIFAIALIIAIYFLPIHDFPKYTGMLFIFMISMKKIFLSILIRPHFVKLSETVLISLRKNAQRSS